MNVGVSEFSKVGTAEFKDYDLGLTEWCELKHQRHCNGVMRFSEMVVCTRSVSGVLSFQSICDPPCSRTQIQQNLEAKVAIIT